MCTWGGTYTEAQRRFFFEPFERETGIRVRTVGVPDIAKIRAMVQARAMEWDLVDAEEQMIPRPVADDMLDRADFRADAVVPSGRPRGVAPLDVRCYRGPVRSGAGAPRRLPRATRVAWLGLSALASLLAAAPGVGEAQVPTPWLHEHPVSTDRVDALVGPCPAASSRATPGSTSVPADPRRTAPRHRGVDT